MGLFDTQHYYSKIWLLPSEMTENLLTTLACSRAILIPWGYSKLCEKLLRLLWLYLIYSHQWTLPGRIVLKSRLHACSPIPRTAPQPESGPCWYQNKSFKVKMTNRTFWDGRPDCCYISGPYGFKQEIDQGSLIKKDHRKSSTTAMSPWCLTSDSDQKLWDWVDQEISFLLSAIAISYWFKQ